MVMNEETSIINGLTFLLTVFGYYFGNLLVNTIRKHRSDKRISTDD